VPASVCCLTPTVEALREAHVEQRGDVPVQVWDVLTTLVDLRDRRGRRHELASVVVIALAAVLGGAGSLAEIAGWAGDQPRWALQRVGCNVARRACPRSAGSRWWLTWTCWTPSCTRGWPRSPRLRRFQRRSGPLPWTAGPAAAPWPATGPGCTCSPSSSTPSVSPWVRSRPRRKGSRSSRRNGIGSSRPDQRGGHRGRVTHPTRPRPVPAPPRGRVPVHRQGQPTHPARPAAYPALGPGPGSRACLCSSAWSWSLARCNQCSLDGPFRISPRLGSPWASRRYLSQAG